MGSVVSAASDIAKDLIDEGTKLLEGGGISQSKKLLKEGDEALSEIVKPVAEFVRGTTLSGVIIPEAGWRAIENHPIETIAAIVTAGASLETTAAAGTAETGAAADAYMTGGITGTTGTGTAATSVTGAEGAKVMIQGAPGAAEDAYMTGGMSGAETTAPAVGAPAPTLNAPPPTTEVAPGGAMDMGQTGGMTNYTSPTDEGTLSRISAWAEKNPKLASSLLTGAGMTVAGAAKGAFDYASMKEKAQLDRDTLLEVARQKPALYQQFVQQSSAGGGGVVMPFSASGTRPLTTTAGNPVFGPRGIIGSRIGG